ncbi:hypothetical protein [Cerasicoccus maritimus]|uniref:hypothetical protein n=1 Tax=Cerasicoccus maritimus TaxID=490089 RepID=UPI00285260B0|nr:hypothetical protein [Cerasicoccus maritimus]
MNLEQQIEILNEVAENIGGEVYEGYSGRFMYGAKCYGIVCEEIVTCIEEAAEQGIKGAKYDNLGLQYIVYWPHLRRD